MRICYAAKVSAVIQYLVVCTAHTQTVVGNKPTHPILQV